MKMKSLTVCMTLSLIMIAALASAQTRKPNPYFNKGYKHEQRDKKENVRDHREDRRDRKEDICDRREDKRDLREDKWDAKHNGGKWDRKEDKLDRKEDKWDRKEDARDRKEDAFHEAATGEGGMTDANPTPPEAVPQEQSQGQGAPRG